MGFKQVIKEFFNPESAVINLGAVKLKYSEKMRQDVSDVLAFLEGKRVLFARIEDELWGHVFDSLRQIREALVKVCGSLTTKGPRDVKAATDFMQDLVVSYLAEYEADFMRFMDTPSLQQIPRSHREREWPRLGEASDDLIALRKVLHAIIENLNKYAQAGEVVDWEEPKMIAAKYWYSYAKKR